MTELVCQSITNVQQRGVLGNESGRTRQSAGQDCHPGPVYDSEQRADPVDHEYENRPEALFEHVAKKSKNEMIGQSVHPVLRNPPEPWDEDGRRAQPRAAERLER